MCYLVKRKVRIRTILGFAAQTSDPSFSAIILGLRTQTSDPQICCANLKSTLNHLGSRNQTSVIHGNNPRSIAEAKQLGHPQKRSHNRSRGKSNSTFCGKEATNDCTRKAARPSAATKHDRSCSRTRTPALQATMVNN